MKKIFLFLFMFIILSISVFSDTIYVLGENHEGDNNAIQYLRNLGHSVIDGNLTTLSGYSAYDQVWDLRYNTAMSSADQTAMGNYLANGGRMFIIGENSSYDTRNNSVTSFIAGIGAGTITLGTNATLYNDHWEYFTTLGQVFQNPNYYSQIRFRWSRSVVATKGFLATELSSNSGVGSMWAWDFGNITGKETARLIVSYDINQFDNTAANGAGWVENIHHYLSAPVPEPSILILTLIGILCGFLKKSF